ncbi:hypothetical protein [Puia dinghuensis]|uniref:Uncharacterized protein n=1 Tax=Puia dinghuensis TaxID=1792502 RepID=A0A8J2UDJ9_9BACT|nr:hypothetical protein [Puia dinghuensis]GGB01565.1 hypothetical protein GCM10011511_26100 [Puia dinghuensis]
MLQYLHPDGHTPICAGIYTKVKAIMPDLIGKIQEGWTPIPRTELSVHLGYFLGFAYLNFRKQDTCIYMNVCGFKYGRQDIALGTVASFYAHLNLGIPEFPRKRNWVHIIPMGKQSLTPQEKLLMHQITEFIYWIVYRDIKRKKRKRQNL